jgi:hypothetical protein
MFNRSWFTGSCGGRPPGQSEEVVRARASAFHDYKRRCPPCCSSHRFKPFQQILLEIYSFLFAIYGIKIYSNSAHLLTLGTQIFV